MFFGRQAWISVEYNSMENWSATPPLKLKYDFVNFVIKVGRVGQKGDLNRNNEGIKSKLLYSILLS